MLVLVGSCWLLLNPLNIQYVYLFPWNNDPILRAFVHDEEQKVKSLQYSMHLCYEADYPIISNHTLLISNHPRLTNHTHN